MRGNIKHNFIRISVSIVGCCPRRVGTHMCTKLYMCEFIFPHILDSCVGMRTHMYIIYKIMLVCCRVPSKMRGNVVWVCGCVCAVTAIQDAWEYRFTLHSADFIICILYVYDCACRCVGM